MKTFYLVFFALLIGLIPINSQTLVYKNDAGNVAKVLISQSGINISIDQQNPFFLNSIGANNGFYLYSNSAGGAGITLDFKKLSITVYGVQGTADFVLIGTDGDSSEYPQNNTQQYSGRSINQIQNDINSTRKRLSDNENTLRNLQEKNQSMTLWPSYQRMIQNDENRLNQLQQELRNAKY